MSLTEQILKEISSGVNDLQDKYDDFESYLDMFNAERSEKDYDWKSNIFIPEFPSQINSQISVDVDQYFSQKEFVSAYLQDKSEVAQKAAGATSECINRTLNSRRLYHYLKFVRAKLFNYIGGYVYASCTWKKDVRENVKVGTRVVEEAVSDLNELPQLDDNNQPVTIPKTENVYEDVIIDDRFDYDILDTRQVVCSPEYTYSLQEKRWVSVVEEVSLDELLNEAGEKGYKNLAKLKSLGSPPEVTELWQKLNDQNRRDEGRNLAEQFKQFEKFTYYGKQYVIVNDVDPAGTPIDVSIGVDEEGNKLSGAILDEVLITIVKNRSGSVMLKFNSTPYRDTKDQAFRPLIRGLCYVHPTDDEGIGDGLYGHDLQVGINDSINLANDRQMLATIPVLLEREYATEDNHDIYIAPGHRIGLQDPKNDLTTLDIPDNTGGQLGMAGLFAQMMQQSSAIHPPSMGRTGAASTSATATADTASKTGVRMNYKSLTFENTFFEQLYWMIQQMTFRFAEEETLFNLMGDKVYDFNPELEYYYKPVSQAIETEHSKEAKRRDLSTVLGYIVNLGNANMINLVMGELLTTFGKEIEQYKDALITPEQAQAASSGSGTQGQNGSPTSNQFGIPQSGMEQNVRGK